MNHLDDAQRSIFSLDDAFVRYEHRKTTAREQVERLVSRLLNHRNESYKLSMGDFDNLPPHKYNTTQLLTEMINPLHERLELLNDSLLTNGLEYVDVPRDGNCFFRAILHTLNRSTDYPLPVPATAAQLRDSAIKTLQEHAQDMFELDVLHTQLSQDYQETDPPLFSYCEKMKQDGTYADHIIITAVSY